MTKPRTAWFVAAPLVALCFLAATHFLVDWVATLVNPLWPGMERQLGTGEGGLLWVYVAWSIATSFSQLAFGFWADRFHGRWLIWMGPVVAVICMCCIGLSTSPMMLCVLLVFGGLGIAAFHPEAAATAGSLAPEHRSRAMAIFALSGYLGQSIGPLYSGTLTDRLGLQGLAWTMAWALPMLMLLIGLRRTPVPVVSQPESTPSLANILEGKAGTLVLLLSVGALRIMPALGVPLAWAYLLKQQHSTNAQIGGYQSAFMAGIGTGGMVCAAMVSQHRERLVLWLMPLCAVPSLVALCMVRGPLLVFCIALSGFLLGVAMPVYISYGQQLLPRGQRVASSITMGVSWGVGGALVAASVWVFNRFDALNLIFLLFAFTCTLSSLLCFWLPLVSRSEDEKMDGAIGKG